MSVYELYNVAIFIYDSIGEGGAFQRTIAKWMSRYIGYINKMVIFDREKEYNLA